ncbi:hypothetical protein ACFLUC_00235 [Chloroflexota bacterium]
MIILEILKIVAGIATILTGMFSLFWPLQVRSFTGLDVVGGRGVTEIRSILGGFFIGLGAAVLFLNDPVAYQTLGIAYLVVASVRTISMFVDKSIVQSNILSVIAEVILGVILIL